jgi:hypothetical protein
MRLAASTRWVGVKSNGRIGGGRRYRIGRIEFGEKSADTRLIEPYSSHLRTAYSRLKSLQHIRVVPGNTSHDLGEAAWALIVPRMENAK